ncbi:UNKNOWN [Stylonychia lemnae]|uniref:Uncharacterized protein n=1 Tax=Stylonychia lemnae TaxID=5949 RepID=A0A078ALJ0_STYLE|nr:UNKNOWN [Stylonychia lemnae]|eukprot:CDW82272.1 UNKNOWN [Stylonychia lemnae]
MDMLASRYRLTETPMRYTNHHKRKPLDSLTTTKYQYPQVVKSSQFRQDYKEEKPIPKEIFNLEREHRIINPHKMQLLTMTQTDFKPFVAPPRVKTPKEGFMTNAPSTIKSDYKSDYPDWGANPIFREKRPQYPFYALQFKGNTSYKDGFQKKEKTKTVQDQMRETSNSRMSRIKQISHYFHQLRIQTYVPAQFTFQTSMQSDYQPFTVKSVHIKQSLLEKQMCKPKSSIDVRDSRKSKTPQIHYTTTQKLNYTKHNYKPPQVDYIPYP